MRELSPSQQYEITGGSPLPIGGPAIGILLLLNYQLSHGQDGN